MKTLQKSPFSVLVITFFLLLCGCHPNSNQASLDVVGLAYASDYPQSADQYLQKANTEAGDEQLAYRMRAAGRLLQDGMLDRAEQILNGLNANNLPAEYAPQLQLLRAKLAILRNQGNQALTILSQVNEPEKLRDPLPVFYHDLLAAAYLADKKPINSVRERIQLQTMISDPKAMATNIEQLWDTLSHVPSNNLNAVVIEEQNGELRNWVELAYLVDEYKRSPQQASKALKVWQENHPNHPGLSFIPPQQDLNTQLQAPNQIALMLPMTGKFAGAGKAVRNGFMQGYYNDLQANNHPVKIRLYDTSSGKKMDEIYNQAVADGATFIVGPLRKNNVDALATRKQFPVPTLALNYIPTEIPRPNLFQFGISPQDEAQQVASKAWQDGHRLALVIAPKGTWGEGIAYSFTTQWTELGGTVMGQMSYDKNANLDRQIRHILQVDQSQQRRRELQRIVGTRLQSQVRRRQDADMLFIIGSPVIARQIRPLLKFYYAGNIPVYAASMIYSGNLNEKNDRDIEGVRFCDMPWILQANAFQATHEAVAKLWPRSVIRNSRLYAIGLDSFLLAHHLDHLTNFPGTGLAAASGRLYLSPNQQISRQLLWAEFHDGSPKVI